MRIATCLRKIQDFLYNASIIMRLIMIEILEGRPEDAMTGTEASEVQ